ncbi:hypothetical protein Tco_0201746 [Tanacetum coccineum]
MSFRMTAEQFSLTGVLVNSKILSLLFKSFLNIGANLGMCRRASAKLSSKWRFRKISINFKAKRSSFSRTFSLFTLDGYGKVVLDLGMTTGSSIWTIGGWTSLVLPLGSNRVPLSPSDLTSITEVEFLRSSQMNKNTASGGDCSFQFTLNSLATCC